MAWTYADWNSSSYGDSEKLERLQDHIAEVAAEIKATMAAGGESYDTANLRNYLKDLYEQEERLRRRVAQDESKPGQTYRVHMITARQGR